MKAILGKLPRILLFTVLLGLLVLGGLSTILGIIISTLGTAGVMTAYGVIATYFCGYIAVGLMDGPRFEKLRDGCLTVIAVVYLLGGITILAGWASGAGFFASTLRVAGLVTAPVLAMALGTVIVGAACIPFLKRAWWVKALLGVGLLSSAIGLVGVTGVEGLWHGTPDTIRMLVTQHDDERVLMVGALTSPEDSISKNADRRYAVVGAGGMLGLEAKAHIAEPAKKVTLAVDGKALDVKPQEVLCLVIEKGGLRKEGYGYEATINAADLGGPGLHVVTLVVEATDGKTIRSKAWVRVKQ
jgi:hypothetical protein